eukprot:TRINITY_DN15737_c2_g1_i1.p1 TRINITY_DN15737_c2_g1~~TRINITY_DN15737_c2_g1_i1.p1  ORF type:complete len:284 (-),score=73.88 TRINITY_DN15737_c2_g1_i1:157-1008(-)
MAPPIRVISIAEAVGSRQSAFVGQALPFTVLFLSLLLLVLSIVRRSLERSAGKRSAAFVRQTLQTEPTAFSLLRRLLLNSDVSAAAADVEDSRPATKKEKKKKNRKTPEEVNASDHVSEVFEALSKIEAQACRPAAESSAVSELASKPASVDVPAEAAEEDVELPPGLESSTCFDATMPSESSWGCEASKTYGKSLLLAHREVSLRIPDAPPGLSLPPGVEPKFQPGFAARAVHELQAPTKPAAKKPAKQTVVGSMKTGGRRQSRRQDGGRPAHAKTQTQSVF